MLEALGGPGERSILSQKRRTGNGDGEEEKDDVLRDGESREDNDVVEEKRENDESPGSHMSESVDEWSEGKAEKREEEEEDEEKRVNSEEDSEEENMIKDKQGKYIFFLYVRLSFVCNSAKLQKQNTKTLIQEINDMKAN